MLAQLLQCRWCMSAIAFGGDAVSSCAEMFEGGLKRIPPLILRALGRSIFRRTIQMYRQPAWNRGQSIEGTTAADAYLAASAGALWRIYPSAGPARRR